MFEIKPRFNLRKSSFIFQVASVQIKFCLNLTRVNNWCTFFSSPPPPPAIQFFLLNKLAFSPPSPFRVALFNSIRFYYSTGKVKPKNFSFALLISQYFFSYRSFFARTFTDFGPRTPVLAILNEFAIIISVNHFSPSLFAFYPFFLSFFFPDPFHVNA